MSGRKYLRAADITTMTGMSLRTVRRWIKEEILPSAKIRGARLVTAEAVEILMSGSSSTTDSELEEIIDEVR